MYKGATGLNLEDTSVKTASMYALGVGVGCGLLMIPTVLPYMRRQIEAKYNEDGTLKPVSFEWWLSVVGSVVGAVLGRRRVIVVW